MTKAPHEGIIAEDFEIDRGGIALRGDLWRPAAATGKVPIVLFIAGSGPTDRDGNSVLGIRTDAYRMLAEALAAHGIASLRYDKRGVGQSGTGFDAARVTIDDFAADALALAEQLRADPRFSSLAILGHSEGGLLALMIAAQAAPDALVLVATAGRPVAALLREQLGRQLDAKDMAEFERLLVGLRSGAPLDPVPPSLAPLFNPYVRAFLRSELDLDPLPLLRAYKGRTAILQGGHDAQVTPADAYLLAGARPDAKLTILPSMNHVLKEEPSATLPQPSYTDPARPLAAGLVDAVAAAVGAP